MKRRRRNSPTSPPAPRPWSCTRKTSPCWPQPGIAKPQTELPADYEQRLIKNDFAWASKNRDEILAEWRKRYDGKSEKVAKQ